MKVNLENLQITNEKLSKKSFDSININITGDWAPNFGNISDICIEKQEKYYGDLTPYFKNSDLNIVNLETVIDTEVREFLKGAVSIIDKPEVLSSLKSIDTHLVCMANNHIMDNGKDGLVETIKYIEQNSIDYIGAGLNKEEIYKPFLYEKDNQKIAVINTAEGEEANEKYNGHIGASDIESYKIIDQIRESKQNGYFVIIIAHAGVEFIPTPPPHIQKLYRIFVEEGVDLVIGHHPHVPQGFEIYKDVPIFYSLGNFVMWKQHWRKNCYHSYFLNIEIVDNKLSYINLVPFEIKKDSLSLISKMDYSFKIKELNELLSKSNEIWKEYLFSTNLKDSYISEFFSIFYNYDKHKYNQINYHTTLSKKYIHLESMKCKLKSNPEFKNILDRWQIKYKKNKLSKIKNILNPIYNILSHTRKVLGQLKRKIK
jgi:poly-gamma-glutamate capsule biosynthesis protein CapA/YwtB (metallophosphatase superfamily)